MLTEAESVMGATGSGKTTFINMASKSNLRIGRGLESCTHIVQTAAPFVLDGRTVTLIDTPGFDDTQKSDTEILRMIAIYLSTAYENGKKLAGVIYLHRTSDFRVGGISRRNFKMFRELCGDDSLKNVLIVTNMWGEVDLQVGYELSSKDIFFKPALDKGAQSLRHNNTIESAHNIVRQVMRNPPVTLQIQEELVDQKKDISETAAGIELTKELREQAEKHRQAIVELQREMRGTGTVKDLLHYAIKAKDEETRQELEVETRKLQQEMERIQRESSTLVENYRLEKAKMEAHMKEMAEAARREAEKAAESHRQQMEMLEQQLRNTEASMTRERGELQTRLNEMRREYENSRRRRGGFFSMIGGALDRIFGI
ncbi:P-loop containing nucleoside triphosphate hydrolase protein [Amanita muscaria]